MAVRIHQDRSFAERNRKRPRTTSLYRAPQSTPFARRFVSHSILFLALVVAGAGLIAVGDLNDEFLQEELLETINRQYADTLVSQTKVQLDLVPDSFVHGLLVYHDPQFYEHDGLLLLQKSTITQQLARSFLRSAHEPSINRKLRELKVARVLESNFTKDQILEMYLNRTFWGNRAHGLAAAAMVYFDKSYTELTPSESAMLVPFLDGPSAFNMLKDPETAAARQQDLLSSLNAEI
jgi:penicillin-binding protein 1A